MTSARNREALEVEHRQILLDETMNASCAMCDWTFTGTAGEAISAQRLHRLQHGYVPRKHNRPGRHIVGEKWRKK